MTKKIKGTDYVVCPICKRRYATLGVHCTQIHKMSKEQVLKLYPNTQWTSDVSHKKWTEVGLHMDKVLRKDLERYYKLKKEAAVLGGKKSRMTKYIADYPEKAHKHLVRASKRAHELHPDMWKSGLEAYNIVYKNDYPNEYHEERKLSGIASDISQRKNPEKYHNHRVKYHTIYKEQYPEKYHNDRVKCGQASVRAQYTSPNGLESYLLAIIQKHNSPFQFIGNGSFWLGNHNPDFISTNHVNVVIEVFGSYWHSQERTGRTREQEEQYYIQHYSQFGYKCYPIWEDDLYAMPEEELKEWLVNTLN